MSERRANGHTWPCPGYYTNAHHQLAGGFTCTCTCTVDPVTAPAEAIMPSDDRTRRVITVELDEWWASLTPGQKMTVHLAAS